MDAHYKRLIFASILLLTFDYVWLSLNMVSYKNATIKVQKSPFEVKLVPAILSYALLIATLAMILSYYSAHKSQYSKNHFTLVAFLLGIIIYGIYNATNAALLTNYSTPVAIKDTIWGGFLLATTVTLSIHIVA